MTRSHFLENVVIITGASAGIGRELALLLAEQGAWLALAGRNAKKLEEVSSQCRERGCKAVVVPTDVAEQSQCKNLIKRTVAAYSRIDTLINNAGISHGCLFAEAEPASLGGVVDVNRSGWDCGLERSDGVTERRSDGATKPEKAREARVVSPGGS